VREGFVIAVFHFENFNLHLSGTLVDKNSSPNHRTKSFSTAHPECLRTSMEHRYTSTYIIP
jgi:hypothetical protein